MLRPVFTNDTSQTPPFTPRYSSSHCRGVLSSQKALVTESDSSICSRYPSVTGREQYFILITIKPERMPVTRSLKGGWCVG